MKSKEIDIESLISRTENLRQYFLAELTLLREISNLTFEGRAHQVRVLTASACSTGSSIAILGTNPESFYSEMMMLARSFIEKIINFLYLHVCDEEDYHKFLFHPMYRAYHNSDISKYTSKAKLSFKYTGKDKLKTNPTIAKALELFSETNPRKNWSDLNVDKKVSIIDERSEIKPGFLLMNTLTIYSNASEALHGSLFGCALSTGAYSLDVDHSNISEVKDNLYRTLMLLYIQLGTMIHIVVEYKSKEISEEILEASRKNQDISMSVLKEISEKKSKS